MTTQQLWCNSDIYHFDLSYWAFQQLAHPTYGVMMVDFRYSIVADTPFNGIGFQVGILAWHFILCQILVDSCGRCCPTCRFSCFRCRHLVVEMNNLLTLCLPTGLWTATHMSPWSLYLAFSTQLSTATRWRLDGPLAPTLCTALTSGDKVRFCFVPR